MNQSALRSENIKLNNGTNIIKNEIALKVSILHKNSFGLLERVTKLEGQIGQGTSSILGSTSPSNELQELLTKCQYLENKIMSVKLLRPQNV